MKQEQNFQNNCEVPGNNGENPVLDMVLREWPNIGSNDRVKITQLGDTFEIVILEDGIGGPYKDEPIYMAPRKHVIRVREQDAKYDRRYLSPFNGDSVRAESLNLHVQASESGSSVLIGWRAYGFDNPRKTLEGLFRRACGIFDVHDYLLEVVEKDSIEVMIQHQAEEWRHWLLCKNGDKLNQLPFQAQQFLRSTFGHVLPEFELAFRNPELLEYGCRMPIPENYLPIFKPHQEHILQTEMKLRQIQDIVTGKAALRKKLGE